MSGAVPKKSLLAARPHDDEEHRLVHDGAGIQIEVWRRAAVIDVPAETVLDLARATLDARAQLELPIDPRDARTGPATSKSAA